jgi:hypothetical protein
MGDLLRLVHSTPHSLFGGVHNCDGVRPYINLSDLLSPSLHILHENRNLASQQIMIIDKCPSQSDWTRSAGPLELRNRKVDSGSGKKFASACYSVVQYYGGHGKRRSKESYQKWNKGLNISEIIPNRNGEDDPIREN